MGDKPKVTISLSGVARIAPWDDKGYASLRVARKPKKSFGSGYGTPKRKNV